MEIKTMADTQNVASELDALQGMYASTEPASAGVPDGNYDAIISDMKIQKSASGNLQCMTKLIIQTEGKYFEKSVNSFHTLNQEEGLAYFKGFVAMIGMQLPDKFSDLQAACNDFVAENKDVFKITVKTGKTGFKNVYVNGK